MIVFGNKKTAQYVELEIDENYHITHKWVNYPAEIIYYSDTHDYKMCSHVIEEYLRMFKDCKDIEQARRILDNTSFKEKIIRTVEKIREQKNKAFDNMRGYDSDNDPYWFGVFDALRWVLGDEVEEFENV